MIRLAVQGGLSVERGRLEALAELVDMLGVRTLRTGVNLDWTQKEAESIRAFLDEREIRVGEVPGLFKSLSHPDRQIREEVIERYKRKIRLAGIVGAHCTGFAPGTCNPVDSKLWLHRENWSEETWGRFIRSTAELAVEAEACGVTMAAHPMITSPLCSIERMRRLVDEVGSPRVKILLDPVNITSIETYFDMTGFLNRMFDVLGDDIVAMHAKDVEIYSESDFGAPWRQSIFHVNEALPGKGLLDYDTILRRLDGLSGAPVLIIEHIQNHDETILAKHHLEYIARKNGVTLG